MSDLASFAAAPTQDLPGTLLRRLARFDDEFPHPSRACDTLNALADALTPSRLRVCPGDELFRTGGRCATLFVLNAGIFRTSASATGDIPGGFRFRGDWLGLDAVGTGRHPTSAVALDSGEVWAVRLDALLVACAVQPVLMNLLRAAMATENERRRCGRGLGAAAAPELHVADFLLDWSIALRRARGTRATLRVARSDVGAYLGLAPDCVGRALARLQDAGALRVAGIGGREVVVDDPAGLDAYLAYHGLRGTLQ